MASNVNHLVAPRHSAAFMVIVLLVGGCPGSPLAELLEERRNGGATTADGAGQGTQADLPRPLIFASYLQDNTATIEFGLSEDSDTSEVFGYTVYRSDDPDGRFTRQRAFARFDELIMVDQSARPGTEYFYYVVTVGRLGNESEPSENAIIKVPLAPNQVLVHADELMGRIDINRFGVSDLNAGEEDFADRDVQQLIQDLGPKWWRVGTGRWDAGQFLTEQAINEREFFVGSTMADAQSPESYNWAYLDLLIENVLASGARPIVTFDTMPRSLARTNELLFRVPLFSWSDNVRNSPPRDNAVFAEVVKRVIMHYTKGWANGQMLDLPYWEIWHAPDLDETFGDATGSTWSGTQDEFNAMYAAVHRVVKSEFGSSVKLGGAGFASADSIGPFLDALRDDGVSPDFVSFVAEADLPAQVGFVMRAVENELSSRGLDDVEIIISDWNMALPVIGRNFDWQFFTADAKLDSSARAVHYLAVVQDLIDLDVTIALHDGLRDRITGFNPGLLRRDNSPKPVSLLVEAMQIFSSNNNRLAIEPDTTVALAGINEENTWLSLLLVNPNQRDVTFTLDFRSLPWRSDQSFNWSLRVLSDQTFVLGGFSDALEGTQTGDTFGLQPLVPPFSVLAVDIEVADVVQGDTVAESDVLSDSP